MSTAELLYLSQKEVIDVGLTLVDAIGIVEEVLRQHGDGQVENPPKPGVHPLPDAFIHAMPALLKRKGLVGMKWVSGFFSNPSAHLPSISGLIVLNDGRTGLPTAVMDCAYITALRTAAASGVAAKHLARADAATVGIVGAGLQGRYNLLALREVVPGLRRAQVFDTSEATLSKFVADMGRRLDFEVVAVAGMEAAFEGADIAVTATGWLDEPIFRADWVAEGMLVLPVHSRGWEPRTLHEVDKFIVDDWQQFHHSMGEPGGMYHPMPQPDAELGQIVLGTRPGRESPSERIIDFNYGLAVYDIAMATEVLARAGAAGLGTRLPRLDGRCPFVDSGGSGPVH